VTGDGAVVREKKETLLGYGPEDTNRGTYSETDEEYFPFNVKS